MNAVYLDGVKRTDAHCKATHPRHAYYEHRTGLLLLGRPIRSNFYVYKMAASDGEALNAMLSRGVRESEVLAFLKRVEIRWSQRIDRDGFEE